MPVFSLPGKYGIGCFLEEAYRFVDFLKAAGQKYWQILPLGPTGYGDSPYQSFSVFAGNPYFIDPDALRKKGLLREEELQELDTEGKDSRIDYGWIYEHRLAVLKKAFARWKKTEDPDFPEFLQRTSCWLEDYALFMAEKDAHNGSAFCEWEDDIRFRKPEALEREKIIRKEEILFYEFLQYEFMREWEALKSYANAHGIQIIGDIPIYVAPDSADFWANPSLFQTDEKNLPSAVAGVPPDGFSADGQLWGNPLYDWEEHRRTGYSWWVMRMRRCVEFYDVVRIDHFRGFDEYYSVKAGEETAAGGVWKKGPGLELFQTLRKEIGSVSIIAEDLGYITDSVRKLVKDTGYPNMRVFEFGFDSRDSSGRWAYLPFNYINNCVVYTGTHDNETLAGWMDNIMPTEMQELMDYVGYFGESKEELVDQIIRVVEGSVADLCMIPLQDWLHLDNTARINHPSTTGKNWTWRVSGDKITGELAEKIRGMTNIYGRKP